MVPLAYETWAFPFRCALCSSASSILIYSDISCDVMFLLDILVSGCRCLHVCLPVTTWHAHAQFVLCDLSARILLMSAMHGLSVDIISDFASAQLTSITHAQVHSFVALPNKKMQHNTRRRLFKKCVCMLSSDVHRVS